jgi:hypothetical protein
MKRLAFLPAAVALWGCDSTQPVDGTRGVCAEGGQILGECPPVETAEDACWKLVQCGSFPLDNEDDPNNADWGTCVQRIERLRELDAAAAIACIDAASCDQLTVRGSPTGPFEWPDCLEYP